MVAWNKSGRSAEPAMTAAPPVVSKKTSIKKEEAAGDDSSPSPNSSSSSSSSSMQFKQRRQSLDAHAIQLRAFSKQVKELKAAFQKMQVARRSYDVAQGQVYVFHHPLTPGHQKL
jgi:hypothetical protein